jgi:hypothetical protein
VAWLRGPAPRGGVAQGPGAGTTAGAVEFEVGHPRRGQPHRLGPAGVPQVERERRRGSTVVRIGREPATDDGDQRGRSLRRQFRQVRQMAGGSDRQGVGRCRGVPRRHAGEGMEGRGCDAEHVRRRAGRATAGDGRIDVGGRDLARGGLAEHPGHAEVGEDGASLRGEDDVAGRQVPVDDAVLMGVRERGGDRRDRGDHLARPQPPPAGEQCREAAALQQFQDQGDAGRPAAPRLVHDLEQPDQVRMVELAEQRRLSGLSLRLAVDQHLDRDRAPTSARHRPPDLAGAAPAEADLQGVPGHDRRIGGPRGCGGIGSGHAGDRGAHGASPVFVIHRPPGTLCRIDPGR